MQHIDNLMGEQGGAILEPTDSFTASTYGTAQVKAMMALEDASALSAITQPDVANSDYWLGYTFAKGDMIWGITTAATVSAGAFQVFLHKKTTA